MTHDLGQFKKTLIYNRKAPIDELLRDMTALRDFDVEHERWTALELVLGLVGLSGFLLGVLGIVRPEVPKGIREVSFVVFVVSGGLMVLPLILHAWRSRYNLENRRYELAERILRFLRKDSRPDAEVSVEVDFRRASHKAKHIRKGKVGVWSVNYYTDPWLKVGGRLLDGTAYRFRLVEHLQVRSKTYRGQSGKTKSKTKHKSASHLVLGLKVKTRRYPRLPEIKSVSKDAPKAVQLPEWATLKACRVTVSAQSGVGNLLLKTATKQPWTCAPIGHPEEPTSGVRWFAMSFLSLYQVLNIARVPEKA